jgi:hypothetical protein
MRLASVKAGSHSDNAVTVVAEDSYKEGKVDSHVPYYCRTCRWEAVKARSHSVEHSLVSDHKVVEDSLAATANNPKSSLHKKP